MGTRERQIDRAIARAQRGEFFRMLWESKVLLGSSVFLLAVIGFGASFTSTPPRLQASVLGHALNEVNVMVTRKGQEVRREIVELDTGARVQLDIPAIGPIRHNAEIRVEIYAKGWGPFHQVTYRFAGYPAAPGQS